MLTNIKDITNKPMLEEEVKKAQDIALLTNFIFDRYIKKGIILEDNEVQNIQFPCPRNTTYMIPVITHTRDENGKMHHEYQYSMYGSYLYRYLQSNKNCKRGNQE